MSLDTLPSLVFSTENSETSAPAVLAPGLNDITLTRHHLQQASQQLADLILSKSKVNESGVNINGQPVVALALPNGVGFVCTFLGLVSRGAIAAPLNPAYTVPEYEFYLSDSKASVLVVDAADASEAHLGIVAARKLGIPVCSIKIKQDKPAPLELDVVVLGEQPEEPEKGRGISNGMMLLVASPTADSIALILHTSGTTGKPKAVPLSHANLCHGARNVAQSCPLGPSDRGYLIQVLFHIHGIVAGLLAPLASGGSVVVPGRFDAKVAWQEFVASRCSWLSGTPSALQILLYAPQAGPGLGINFLRSCSAPLLPSTMKELQEAFHCPVLEAYAMTENAHQISANIMSQTKPGYVGKPIGSLSLCIFGDDHAADPLATDVQGEICITGPSVMRGYLENPEANAKAFFTDSGGTQWLRTGDIGVLDSHAGGRLRIVGRKSEIINRGGEKISPPEVDEAMILCSVPHVREAACFAVPDEFFGQEVEAAVVLAKDAPQELRDEATIQRLLEQRLALFKIPKRIHFFEDKIPKGPTGKIQRAQLSKTLAKQADGEVDGKVVSIDPVDLPVRIVRLIAEALRVEADKVQPKVTLLELGADSMNLTRLLSDMRHIGCNIAMSDLILNPTVQEVIDMCMKSCSAGKGFNKTNGLDPEVTEDIEPPPPFSLLKDLIEGMECALSLDSVLADVTKQTGLHVHQLEDVLPLSPEAKWFQSQTLTTKWGLEGTAASFVTMGAPIQDSVDIERLKSAFAEAAKVEPKYLLVSYPNEQGEECRALYFVDSHIVTDNTSRSRLRDNVVKLYLGQATVQNLPQKPLPTGVLVRDLLRKAKVNHASKAKFWRDDEVSHGAAELPPYIPPLEAGVGARVSRWSVDNNAFHQAIWTGDLKGLTLALGMTAPTVVQTIVPLAMAVYEYQGTLALPEAVCFGSSSSSRDTRIPNIDQSRGFAMFFPPFRFTLALARRSLWLHCHQAALKAADLGAHRLLVEAADTARDIHLQYNWRELPAGSLWAQTIEAGPEQFLADFPCHTTVNCMRMGINSIFFLDGEGERYIKWREENGFPLSFMEVLQRCLTFMCDRKDELVRLTLHDLVETVAASFDTTST
ncbi:NRPS protein [Diaporthe australafricana]|uniref:NRPS protein n=1 Tax=Diaporthe australafricana TaxID=127596 RepID=A0ABR3WJD9_9PEZI